MRILAAVDDMQTVLRAADAPHRQLTGVQEWRGSIAEAVLAAQAFKNPPGMEIQHERRWTVRGWQRPPELLFLYGTPTHRAWKQLSNTIVARLNQQAAAAEATRCTAVRRAAIARNADRPRLASQWMNIALNAVEWREAADEAASAGTDLIAAEDAIMRPVGLAIRRAGGTREVALRKGYHTRWRV